jgi:DNA-binding XRE family transcriptional regulator
MVTVYPVLRQYMRENKTTLKDLATVIKVNRFSLCLRLWGVKRWTMTEAVSICCFFNNPDVEHLFSRVLVR